MPNSQQEEYRRIKNLASAATGDPALQRDVVCQIASYVVSRLQELGLSDGGLCHWVGELRYDDFSAEVSALTKGSPHKVLMDQMRALARKAGVRHEGHLGTTSEPLKKALRSEVWRTTSDFREQRAEEKKRKEEAQLEARIAEMRATSFRGKWERPPKLKFSAGYRPCPKTARQSARVFPFPPFPAMAP